MPAFLFAISTQCFAFHKPCRGAAQFLQAEMRRPASRLPVQFYVIRTTFGIFFSKHCTAQHFRTRHDLHKFMNNQTLPLRNGLSRAPAPTSCSDKFAVPQNRYALCGFYVVLWDGKSGAEFFYSDTALILLLVCFSSIAFLHRFCRLAPIEALPQTPTGLCPVPTMGFTP